MYLLADVLADRNLGPPQAALEELPRPLHLDLLLYWIMFCFLLLLGRTVHFSDVHGDMFILGKSRKPWLRQQQNSPNGEVQQA